MIAKVLIWLIGDLTPILGPLFGWLARGQFIARLFNWLFGGITTVQLNGALFMSISLFGTTQTVFSTDEAYKYINAYLLFWIKASAAIILAGVGSLKMFMSTTYSDSLKDKAISESGK